MDLTRIVGWLARALAMLGGAVLVAITVLTVASIVGRAVVTVAYSHTPDYLAFLELPLGWLRAGAAFLASHGVGPVPGDYEMVQDGTGFAIFAFLPWCQLNRGHATVESPWLRSNESDVASVSLEAGEALQFADVGGATLELVGEGFSAGETVRLRIRARDVALARQAQTGHSIRNQLPCVVEEIATAGQAYVEVALKLGGQRLRARITRKSADEMELAPGARVVALLKAVSVERRVARHVRARPPQ